MAHFPPESCRPVMAGVSIVSGARSRLQAGTENHAHPKKNVGELISKPFQFQPVDYAQNFTGNSDDFLKAPLSASGLFPLSLRRTITIPRDTEFVRLDIGLFTTSSVPGRFYEPIHFRALGK
jgi:hypothetical protein